MYWVYILHSKSLDKYYKGYTSDLQDRLKRHNSGYEKSTSYGVPWELVLKISKETKSEAIVLERKLKNLNRERLKAFLLKYQGSNQDD